MKVEDVVDYGAYWNGSKFAARKPSPETAITRCGDNIWHCENGKWWVAPGAIHNEGHQAHDVSGKNALIATEFFYFGEAAVKVAEEFRPLLATTQGHKNTRDRDLIGRFWEWVTTEATKAGKHGMIAYPVEFDDHAACQAHCAHVDDDDLEEA